MNLTYTYTAEVRSCLSQFQMEIVEKPVKNGDTALYTLRENRSVLLLISALAIENFQRFHP